ncbi:hypothetical protein [Neobacillus bataviensis]|nr:hypothetical protein [Neobacillus bataviensis]
MRTQTLDFKQFVSNEKIITDDLLKLLEDKRFKDGQYWRRINAFIGA